MLKPRECQAAQKFQATGAWSDFTNRAQTAYKLPRAAREPSPNGKNLYSPIDHKASQTACAQMTAQI